MVRRSQAKSLRVVVIDLLFCGSVLPWIRLLGWKFLLDDELPPGKESCDQLSVFFDASGAEKSVEKVDKPKRIYRDTLFEDGKVTEAEIDDKLELDAGIESGRSVFHTSGDWKRCNRILQGIQKESEEVLRRPLQGGTVFSNNLRTQKQLCNP